MLDIDLTGKIALVTGGSRGIGGAITRTLCKTGAFVYFTHTGNADYSEAIDGLLADVNGMAKAAVIDATDSSETSSLINKIISDKARLDILVPNVGRNLQRPAEMVSDDEWNENLDINLSSVFYAVRAALPHMLAAGYGRIILIGSSAAYDGGGGSIEYSTSKAGLNGMMLYLVKNYARKGIITNAVHPCVVETDLLKERYPTDADKAKLISQIPVGRLGRPDDVAGMVAYLASPWGDYICGQSILMDGGRTLGK